MKYLILIISLITSTFIYAADAAVKTEEMPAHENHEAKVEAEATSKDMDDKVEVKKDMNNADKADNKATKK